MKKSTFFLVLALVVPALFSLAGILVSLEKVDFSVAPPLEQAPTEEDAEDPRPQAF